MPQEQCLLFNFVLQGSMSQSYVNQVPRYSVYVTFLAEQLKGISVHKLKLYTCFPCGTLSVVDLVMFCCSCCRRFVLILVCLYTFFLYMLLQPRTVGLSVNVYPRITIYGWSIPLVVPGFTIRLP